MTDSSDADMKTRSYRFELDLLHMQPQFHGHPNQWFLTGFASGPKFYKTNISVLKIKQPIIQCSKYIVVGTIILILIEIVFNSV